MEYIREQGEIVMTTKAELARTLARTEELVRELGWVRPEDSLALFEPGGRLDHWSVRTKHVTSGGNVRHVSGALLWLPDSGRSIGRTKREAQDTLQTVNGVLNTAAAQKRHERQNRG